MFILDLGQANLGWNGEINTFLQYTTISFGMFGQFLVAIGLMRFYHPNKKDFVSKGANYFLALLTIGIIAGLLAL